MSLITRCTACETMFRVVPDQLRISDGWVRCGQCGEIFDASRNLVDAATFDAAQPEDTAPEPAAAAPDAAPRDQAPTASPAADRAEAATPAAGDPAAVSPASMDAALPDARLPLRRTADDVDEAIDDPMPRAGLPADPLQPAEPIALPAAVDAAGAPARGGIEPTWGTAPEPADAAMDAPPSFLRRPAEPSRWHRPVARWTLGLLALLLLTTLAAQVLRHERDRVAAIEPRLRPLVTRLCDWTRCRIEPLRQIEAVVIDSSSFTRLRGDVYRLAFSLRNTAPFDLAMPSIELSVTDAQDQAVARRVLAPADFGASAGPLAASGDWSTRISLSVRTGGGDRVAGYRLLAFYP